MDTPPPAPPLYGVLIENARKAARITVQQAADRAGFAKATWIDNARGYRKRSTRLERIDPKPETIAHMARAVGVTARRLEEEGERPDAAEILREILRAQPATPAPATRPRLTEVPPEGLDDALIERMAQDIIARAGKNRRVMEAMWAGTHVPARMRLEKMLDYPRYDPRLPPDFDADDDDGEGDQERA